MNTKNKLKELTGFFKTGDSPKPEKAKTTPMYTKPYFMGMLAAASYLVSKILCEVK